MYGLSAKKVAVVKSWPLQRGGRCGEVAVVEKRLLWIGGHCGEVAVTARWPLWRGGCYGEVAIVERWLLRRGGHCKRVAVVEKWPLWRGGCLVEVRLYLQSNYSSILSTHSKDGAGSEQDKTVLKSHTLCIFPSFIDPFPLIMILAVL